MLPESSVYPTFSLQFPSSSPNCDSLCIVLAHSLMHPLFSFSPEHVEQHFTIPCSSLVTCASQAALPTPGHYSLRPRGLRSSQTPACDLAFPPPQIPALHPVPLPRRRLPAGRLPPGVPLLSAQVVRLVALRCCHLEPGRHRPGLLHSRAGRHGHAVGQGGGLTLSWAEDGLAGGIDRDSRELPRLRIRDVVRPGCNLEGLWRRHQWHGWNHVCMPHTQRVRLRRLVLTTNRRTMIAEMTKEKKYQSRAFLILPMSFNIAGIVGPGMIYIW